MSSGRNELSNQLTVVVVTSAVSSNPDTSMIRRTLSSLVEHEPELVSCRKYIICDACRTATVMTDDKEGHQQGHGEEHTDKEVNPRNKRGWVSSSGEVNYRRFCERLEQFVAISNAPGDDEEGRGQGQGKGQGDDVNANNYTISSVSKTAFTTPPECLSKLEQSSFRNAEVVRPTQRLGFSHAVKLALTKLVSTPFIMVVQHDRPLTRSFHASHLLNAMRHYHEDVKMVSLLQRATVQYIARMETRYAIRLEQHVKPLQINCQCQSQCQFQSQCQCQCKQRLIPLLFWYDSTHVACCSHYKSLVFGDNDGNGDGNDDGDDIDNDSDNRLYRNNRGGTNGKGNYTRDRTSIQPEHQECKEHSPKEKQGFSSSTAIAKTVKTWWFQCRLYLRSVLLWFGDFTALVLPKPSFESRAARNRRMRQKRKEFKNKQDKIRRPRIGEFIEDTFGQYQLNDVKVNGLSVHKRYATWILDDFVPTAMITHSDGRRDLSGEEYRVANALANKMEGRELQCKSINRI